MPDSTIIQTRTYLGNITFTGNEYIASYANGDGIDRGRTEGECVSAFKKRLGQGLKGQLDVVHADNRPTEVYLTSVGPITPAVFGSFAEYVAVPGAGYHLFPDPGDFVNTWANQGYYKKITPNNTLAQGDFDHAPYLTSGMGVLGVKGDTGNVTMLATNYATPSTIALFLGFKTPEVVAQGTIWSTIQANRATSSNPDMAVIIAEGRVSGKDIVVYNAEGQAQTVVTSADASTLYVLCVQRTARGDLSVYMYGSDGVQENSGVTPAGDRGGMAILDGYDTAGPSDVTVGAVTLVSREVTAAERTAYMAQIYQTLRVT